MFDNRLQSQRQPGLKEHAAVDTSNGFVLATELTPASVSDSIYLPYCVTASSHTEDQIKKGELRALHNPLRFSSSVPQFLAEKAVIQS